MKHLQQYIEAEQSALLDNVGAFFAFSDKQFDEQSKPNVKYVSMGGAGLICPKKHADSLHNGLKDIHKRGIARDVKENGKQAIIQRELSNHEAQITGSVDDTLRALAGYPITDKEVMAEFGAFMDHCIEHDLF